VKTTNNKADRVVVIGILIVAGLAIGTWLGARYILDHETTAPATAVDIAPPPPADYVPPVRSTPRASASPSTTEAPVATVSMASPEFRERMKPLLNWGTDMTIATADFSSAEEFATVAHAAKNLDIPFVVLKHRVLNQGRRLAAAIRELKPDADADAEAERARAAARSDIKQIAG
jgi:hypothetical protein